VSIAPQCVLHFTSTGTNILEKNESVLPGSQNPRELGPPIGHMLDETGERSLAKGMGYENFDLVPFLGKPEIECAKIAAVTDT
jgi:hypothetical protein